MQGNDDEWYLCDADRGRFGPLDEQSLKSELRRYASLKEVTIWQRGFEEWKPVLDVFRPIAPPPPPEPPTAPDPTSDESSATERARAAGPTHKYNNFIARNWRGEYPLWVSYWIFGFVANAAALSVPSLLATIFTRESGFNPYECFAIIASAWATAVAASIWQFTGVWRSANKSAARRGLAGKWEPWAVVAKLMVALGVLQSLFAVAKTGIPQVSEAVQIAFMNDPDIPDYAIRVMRNGTEVEIAGGFKFGLASDFQKILSASQQIRVVHLNSVGGRVGEAQKLCKIIKDNHLTTYVSSSCSSACTIAFSAGHQRVVLDSAVLGFHRGSFAGEDPVEDNQELRDIYIAAGFSPSFISRVMSTPSAEIWRPTAQELIEAKVVTRVSDGSDFALSGLPTNVTRDYFSDLLTKDRVVGSLYQAIQERFPKAYSEIVDGYYKGFVNGDPLTEIEARIHDQIADLIVSLRSYAADDVLVDAGNLVADRLLALQKRDVESCFRYAFGGVIDYDAVPSDLRRQEFGIKERIVRSASDHADLKPAEQAVWTDLRARMIARGATADDIDLILKTSIPDAQKARYCKTTIIMFREAAAMPPRQAAGVLRSLLIRPNP